MGKGMKARNKPRAECASDIAAIETPIGRILEPRTERSHEPSRFPAMALSAQGFEYASWHALTDQRICVDNGSVIRSRTQGASELTQG